MHHRDRQLECCVNSFELYLQGQSRIEGWNLLSFHNIHIFWNFQLFVSKLSPLVYHHWIECFVKGLGSYQGQSHRVHRLSERLLVSCLLNNWICSPQALYAGVMVFPQKFTCEPSKCCQQGHGYRVRGTKNLVSHPLTDPISTWHWTFFYPWQKKKKRKKKKLGSAEDTGDTGKKQNTYYQP